MLKSIRYLRRPGDDTPPKRARPISVFKSATFQTIEVLPPLRGLHATKHCEAVEQRQVTMRAEQRGGRRVGGRRECGRGRWFPHCGCRL
jgi:hypothetical protein